MRRANAAKKRHGRHVARTAFAGLLALSLACAPLAALADESPASESAASSAAGSSGSSGDSSSSGASGAVQHGAHATASQALHLNEAAISVEADGACGLFAEAGATLIANALAVTTQGSAGAAVSTSAEGGNISIANSQLSTTSEDAPLLLSAGIVEADNVTGTAQQSAIACVAGEGALLIENSTLASSSEGGTTNGLPANGVAIYRTDDNDITAEQGKSALLQAHGSRLESSATSGAMIYLTNTTADIVLSDTDLAFDEDKVKLLVARGSDATSDLVASKTDSVTFGSAGSNGATVFFTALDQKLDGDIEVDSISSLDLYLLEGSEWKGSSSIIPNAAGSDLASNIVVNIDATSGWIVTENSTVSTLNIEKGGKLVDAEGKAVTIVDADGNTLVDGASNVEVAVVDEFSTTVKRSSANALHASSVDRTAFDEEFGTSTAFGTNGNDDLTDEEKAEQLRLIIEEWFLNL